MRYIALTLWLILLFAGQAFAQGTLATGLGGAPYHQLVANNAALALRNPLVGSAVTRQGFASPGDGGAAAYVYGSAACTLNAGAGDNGAQVRPTSGIGCWTADFTVVPPNPKQWGAKGDGTTNDAAAVQSCINFSTGQACRINGGPYVADGLILPSGAKIEGSGTILRTPNSTNRAGMFYCSGCANVSVSGITADGNKTHETVFTTGFNLNNYQSLTMSRVSVVNANGNGILLNGSADTATSNTRSVLSDTKTNNNTGYGGLAQPPAYGLTVRNHTALRNTYGGFLLQQPCCDPPVAGTMQLVTIEGGDFSYNGGWGVGAAGSVLGWVGTSPIFDSAAPAPVAHLKIIGVHAVFNQTYGIGMQCNVCLLSDSIANNNAQDGFNWAGVLGNCQQCEINNVIADNNGPVGYGADVGCGLGVHINNGSYSGNQVGINAGCTQYSSIRNTSITRAKTAAITVYSAEGSGDGFGIGGFTQTLVITGNRIGCADPNSTLGIQIVGSAYQTDIENNYFQGCAHWSAILNTSWSGRMDNNRVSTDTGTRPETADYDAGNVNGQLLIPDWASVIGVEGNSTITSIVRISEQMIGTGVSGVQVINGGSGYQPNGPFTISGCAVAPTGTLFANRGGTLTGVRLNTPGSGCVNPTISFGGPGTGGSAILLGAPMQYVRHNITLVVGGGSMSISTGNQIYLSQLGNIVNAGTGSRVELEAAYNTFYEISRTIH
jgi:hypothetical protein